MERENLTLVAFPLSCETGERLGVRLLKEMI
jgi:hypothetical protein